MTGSTHHPSTETPTPDTTEQSTEQTSDTSKAEKKTNTIHFREIFAVTSALGLAFLLFAAIWTVFSLPETQWRLASFVGFDATAEEIRYGKENAASSEGALGERGDHSSVVNWVLACTNSLSLADLPTYVRRMYTSNPRLVSTGSSSTDLPSNARIPNRYERAFLELSNALASQRTVLRTRVQSAYVFWQWCAIVTIVLGFATTVLVTLGSTEFGSGDGNRAKLIRLLAITFPALGTLAAAVVAFYGPQAEWNQSSRTLTSISQLHGQMALGVWKLNCLDTKDSAGNTQALLQIQTQLDDWSRRYVDIQIIASASSQSNPASGPSSSSGRDPSLAPLPTGGAQPSK